MKLDDLAEDTARELARAFSIQPSEEQLTMASKALHRMLVEAVSHASDELRDAAVSCCDRDSDVGSRIGNEMERKRSALIANLSSLR